MKFILFHILSLLCLALLTFDILAQEAVYEHFGEQLDIPKKDETGLFHLEEINGITIQPKNILNFDFLDEVYTKHKQPIFIADHVNSYCRDKNFNIMGLVNNNLADYPGSMNKVQQGALDSAYMVPSIHLDNGLQDWGAYEDVKQAALARIEQYRKGDVRLKVILPNGDSAGSSRLRFKLKRHDFLWGAVIRESFFSSPYADVYKENFLKYFNSTGFAIELKPKWRETDMEERTANIAMPWLRDHDIYVRGHTLTWEGYNYVRPEDKAIFDDAGLTDREKGDSLLSSMGKHFHHAIPKWDVACWDVSNETMTNNMVNDLLPDYNTHVHWFKLADSIRQTCGREDLLLYQNDYQVISAISSWALNYTKPGYAAVGRPALYREILDEQIALGAPIEGIGFQSRLKQGILSPDSIYKRLCDFDRYKLPFQATEFEIRDDASKYVYTEAERSLLTEYMMVMYFSHPKVNGFWHWTFADVRSDVDWDYSLFHYNGSPKVNGHIWMDLMDGFFSTDLSLTTDSTGEVDVRGYYGSYDVVLDEGGDIYYGNFGLDSSQTDTVIMVYLDNGLSLSGLEDGAAYALDKTIPVEITAFSNDGAIASIGLYMNSDSIGGRSGSDLTLEYTPDASVEGWNEVTIRIVKENGTRVSHSLEVYFGETLPKITILNQPPETVLAGSTGNHIELHVLETYRPIDWIRASFAGNELLYTDTSGYFIFDTDPLETGEYHFFIEASDIAGELARDTISFTAISEENTLPSVEIKTPGDSSIVQHGSNKQLSVEASVSEGSISYVLIYLNEAMAFLLHNSPYTQSLSNFEVGDYDVIAEAKDNRGRLARDSVFFRVRDTTSTSLSIPHNKDFTFYPNPVQNTLHFNKPSSYEIVAITGRKVLEGVETVQVDVSSLESGLFLLNTEHGFYKLIKK